MPDYRDLVISQIADDERELLERLASVEDDCATYRALALYVIGAYAELTRKHRQLRDEKNRVVDDYRRLRESVMRQAAA
jgi:hypothetical protein